MAHSDNSLVTGRISGTLGKELVFREWEGKTVVAKAPRKRKGDPNSAQAEIQQRFLLASRYARAIIKSTDKSMAEAYATVLRPRQNVYSRALEDFLNPPKVISINTRTYKGIAGDKLTIRAIDDFRVVSVQVEIYAATQANTPLAGTKILAIATDVPGNEGILDVSL